MEYNVVGEYYAIEEGNSYIQSYGLVVGAKYKCVAYDVFQMPDDVSHRRGWQSGDYGEPRGAHTYLHLTGDHFKPYKIIQIGGE